MHIIILVFIAALFTSYLALQNTTPVTVYVFQYTFTFVPLYAVGLLSLFLGLLFGWLLTLKQKFFASRLLNTKEKSIQEYKTEITQLRKHIHDLENENEHLRGLAGQENGDDKSL